MNEDVFSISELNGFIKDVINAGFPQGVWVCGEIQNYNRNRMKRHIFFELVEKEANSQDVKARVGLVIFAGTKVNIDQILQKSENAFALKDDIEVKFFCRVDFYPPHGAVRLVVESIDPTYTLGKLAQEKQKLIALLKKNGTLDLNKRTALPMVPLRIGLITSDDSAAYNDFLDELNNSGYGFKVCVRNTLMQGAKAEADICQAIKELDKLKTIDCLIVTRGGGSLADLSCFDSRKIAETIAQCSHPVLSGIGHEINISIADMAAHTYAKTPTAIAQFLVERITQYIELLQEKGRFIVENAEAIVKSQKQRLKDTAVYLQRNTNQYLKAHHEQLIRISQNLTTRPALILKAYKNNLQNYPEEIKRRLARRFNDENNRLKSHAKL
ncbi:MAG: exodeoxyribonuclease VII large subunit, partial [Candidatus Omnitrophica bacterium]|nr:exodeoxyribonuclease VII large subunit [Candidatus Omnitrophota bacterium]